MVCKEKFEGLKYAEQQRAKEKWIRDNCQEEGWNISSYLGSQDSIKHNYKDGTETFNYHVFKYVDISEEERAEILAKRNYY